MWKSAKIGGDKSFISLTHGLYPIHDLSINCFATRARSWWSCNLRRDFAISHEEDDRTALDEKANEAERA